ALTRRPSLRRASAQCDPEWLLSAVACHLMFSIEVRVGRDSPKLECSMMRAIVRPGCSAIRQGALVALTVTGMIGGAEAKIVLAEAPPAIASKVEPPFKPEPPPSIAHGISSSIAYQLYGALPSWSNSAPLADFGSLRTMAITRSIRNDAIRLRLIREA